MNSAGAFAVSLVGVLSVCIGFGHILTGALFDSMGRRKTMLCANILFFYKYGIYDLYRYGRIYYAVSFKFYCINFKYFYPQTIKTRGVDKLIFVRQPHFLDSI